MQVLGRLALVALLASGTVLIPATGASANPTFTPEEKAAAIVRPAVLYIEVQWEGWVRDKVSGKLWDDESVAFAARCSGFAVSNDGYIVTAGHCVDPGVDGVGLSFFEEIAKRYVEAGVVKQSDAPALVQNMVDNAEVEGKSAGDPAVRKVFAQRGVAKSGLTAGEAMAARVVSFRPVSDGDVALLKVEKSNQPMVKLADSSDVSVGTDVLAIGYPASADAISDATFEPSNKDGKISNKRTENGLPFYETSAATTQGMSGGPVANLNGEIIGLISHGPAGEKQAFNFLAASSLIAEELGKSGVNNDLGKIDKDYRDGLDAYYAGRYTSAIEKFDAVLVAVPSHAQAQEFQQKAVALRETEGEPLGTDALLLLGIGAVVAIAVIVAVIIVIVVWTRRRARPTVATGGYPGTVPIAYPPISVAPTPYSPAPVQPTQVDPAPYSPAPVQPTPYSPAPAQPTPYSPAPYSPAPAQPSQYSLAPAQPMPVQPTPIHPAPQYSGVPQSSAPYSGVAPTPPFPASPISSSPPVPVPQPPPPAPSTPLMYCSNCGNGSPSGTTSCPICGQQFP